LIVAAIKNTAHIKIRVMTCTLSLKPKAAWLLSGLGLNIHFHPFFPRPENAQWRACNAQALTVHHLDALRLRIRGPLSHRSPSLHGNLTGDPLEYKEYQVYRFCFSINSFFNPFSLSSFSLVSLRHFFGEFIVLNLSLLLSAVAKTHAGLKHVNGDFVLYVTLFHFAPWRGIEPRRISLLDIFVSIQGTLTSCVGRQIDSAGGIIAVFG
jgi:hypothetical protein